MKALLFPGQGSQKVGMGLEFYKNFEEVRKLFAEADEALGYKLSKIILEGPDSDLKLTKITQPAIFIVSYSIFRILKKEFNFKIENFKFFAGHSLGEYSALACGESISLKDAIILLHERGKAMQESVPVNSGAMLAVLGCSIDEINNFLGQAKDITICEIANDNAPGQVIVSGDVKSINNFKDLLKANNKKSIILPVSAPFHCSLMKPAAIKMQEKINSVKFDELKIKVISNVTAQPETDPEKIKSLLVEQIYSKVKWQDSINYMKDNGITEFIEIGPGKVLSGLIKRITTNSKSFSINTINDIKEIKI